MRIHEIYALECHGCQAQVEILCEGPHVCPHCGSVLTLEWRTNEAAGNALRTHNFKSITRAHEGATEMPRTGLRT